MIMASFFYWTVLSFATYFGKLSFGVCHLASICAYLHFNSGAPTVCEWPFHTSLMQYTVCSFLGCLYGQLNSDLELCLLPVSWQFLPINGCPIIETALKPSSDHQRFPMRRNHLKTDLRYTLAIWLCHVK